MRKAQNWSIETDGLGFTQECDSFTCYHCQRVVFVPPGQSAFNLGGGCRVCQQLICSKCVDLGTCRPWEEQMLKIEHKYETDKMISRLLGRE